MPTELKIPVSSIPFGDALLTLARGRPDALSALLHDIELHGSIEGTRVKCHCHALRLDANGRPRVRELIRDICARVVDYAIPRTQIKEAQAEFDDHGSTDSLMRLGKEAKDLFTDIEKSGEGGELLLFSMAEILLRLPQLLCKMSLKSSARMHYHGADGLHAGVDDVTGRLILYWGESKIYEDPAAAVRDGLRSLAPYLLKGGDSGAEGDRDLQLLRRHADLADPDLEAALKRYLDPRNIESTEVEFRGLCLIGFDCDAYPCEGDVCDVKTLERRISEELPLWKGQIGKRTTAEKLTTIGIHFFCVPFPSVSEFRKEFRRELGILNGNP